MKKYPYILLLALLSLMGCSDFLDSDNKSNVTTDQFYKTKEGYESLINATFSSLRGIYGKEPWLFCAGTDLYASGRNDVPAGIGQYTDLIPLNANVAAFYKSAYEGIQLANTAIYYADVTEASGSIAQYKAEARFIRAFYYNLLVEQFGGVALVTKMYLDNPEYDFPRESAENIYTFIITELESLKADLPATAKQLGRPSQRAVLHLLAKVYLSRGYETFGSVSDFTKAAAYADEAINGQKLTIAFNDLFWPTNEKNDEFIWSVQYDAASIASNPSKNGNMQQAFFGTYLGGSEDKNKYTTSNLTPTLRLHQLFVEGDSRYEGTFMTQLYNEYYDLYTKTAELNDITVKYYYPAPWEVADTAAWRAANKTRAKAIILPMQENTLTTSGKPTTYNAAMTGDVYGVACVRKFDDPTSLFSTQGSTRDVVISRLGETYLIAAEAYLKANQPALAMARINEVRKRAAEPGYDMSIKENEVTIDFILDERARELAGEYHRWMDLKRTGKLIEYCVKYNPNITSENNFKGTDGQNKILRPIPTQAIQLNHATITQNPGY